jgi:hypothetical protein
MGTCQEKGKFDFTIVIIIVVIVVLIALLFFLIKKLKKKKEDKKDEFGFDEFPPSSSGYRPDKDLGIGTGIPAPKKPSKAIPAPKALSAPKQPTTVPIRPLPKPVKQKEQAKKEIKKKVEEDSDDAFAELEKMSK